MSVKMELWQARLTKVYIACVLFSCFGVAAQKFLRVDPGPIAPIMSALIMLTGAGSIAISIRSWRSVGWVIGIGAVAEIVGLFTGFPFGRYEYTDRWVPTVPLGMGHRFPLLLPLAWLMMVGGSFLFVSQFWKDWRLVLGTAILAAAIDVPMERAMTDVLGYWKWIPPGPLYGAPFLNTVGWVLVGGLAAIGLRRVTAVPGSSRLVLPFFCGFVAWNGFIAGFDPAWISLLAFSVWLGLPQKQNIIGE